MSLSPTEKMSKAKAKLIMYHPFYATIICSLPMIEDKAVQTMATNGKWVRYNPEFVDKMSMDETMFVLCHEVGHCMFAHMFRKGARDHYRWNVAGDYIINDLLIAENIGSMPYDGLHNPQLVQQGGGTTDGVYDLLPEDMKNPNADGSGNTGIDECMGAEGDAAAQAQAESETKVMIAQAAQAAKMQGKLSAKLARLVDITLRPQVSWKDVLRRFVNSRAKVDVSYARPKRRFIADDLYLPTKGGEKLGEFVVAVDCSGSIGAKELNEFAAEIKAIHEDCQPSLLHVVYFDSEVCHHDKFASDETLSIAPHGGGGTAFSPIFRYLDKEGIEPVGVVFLTDLYCSDFGPPTSYPVLWVSTHADQAPWGEVIMMKPQG